MRNALRFRPLGELTTLISSGSTPKGGAEVYLQQGPVMFIRSQNVRMNALDLGDVAFITDDVDAAIKRTRLQRGDVLLNITGASIGRVAPFFLEARANVNQHVCVIRPDTSVLEQRYVAHLIATPEFQRQIDRLQHGGTRQALTFSQIAAFAIPLRTMDEQRRIAEVLDRAEALRAKRRAALAQLDTLTQSIFLDLFGDGESRGWPTATVAGVASAKKGSIRTGPFGSQLLHSEFVAEGIAVIGIDNAVTNEFRWGERRFITAEKYAELKRYTVQPGDVLITIMGTCGRCAVVPDGIPLAINTKHLCCITLDQEKCLPVFLHAYFLRHPLAQRYLSQTAKGAIMSGLNMGIIEGMPILLPPLSVQQDFANRVAAVENLKSAQRRSLAELDALFASLQHRAFRGEL